MTCASWLLLAALAQTHLGEPLGTIDSLARPVAATFGPAGSEANALWVAESGGATSTAGLRAIGGLDASFRGQSAGETVGRRGVGVLVSPTGVAVDGAGVAFATDDVQHAVWRFDPDGTSTRIASRGSDLGEVLSPNDIEVWPRHAGAASYLLVSDRGNRRAQLLSLATGEWKELRSEAGLSEPRAVAFQPRPEGVGASESPAGFLIADGARNQIDRFGPEGRYRSTFSNWGYFPSLISAPGGLDCADGLIFVADTENHRVQAFDMERPGDPTDGLRYRFGVHAIRPGEGAGSLHYPVDLAIDRDAVLLAIVEPLDDRIQIFGRAPGATPRPDPTRAGLGAPAAHFGSRIAASGSYLVTLSPESHRAVAHDLRGKQPIKISELFGFGDRLGMLRTPTGVYLGQEGRELLITDRGNRRLTRARLEVAPDEPVRQDPELETVLEGLDLGSFGIDPGDVTRLFLPANAEEPARAEGDAQERSEGAPATLIAVVDHAHDEVVLFSESLSLVRRIGGRDERIVGLAGITATPAGTLLVLDRFGAEAPATGDGTRRARIVEYAADGQRLGAFGQGLFVDPAAAVCQGDRVWVADAALDRIEVFRREPGGEDGGFQHEGGFGRSGLGRAEFHEPRGLAITGDQRLVVLDFGNHRGQIFDLQGNFLDGFGGRLYTAPLRAMTGKTR